MIKYIEYYNYHSIRHIKEKTMKENFTFDTKKAHEFFSKKISFCTAPYELKNMIENEIDAINIVDVRKYDDYIDGHIPFAIHMPIELFEENISLLDKDKINIFYCYNQFCQLALKACIMASEKGYPVQIMEGGYLAWTKFGFDTVKTDNYNE